MGGKFSFEFSICKATFSYSVMSTPQHPFLKMILKQNKIQSEIFGTDLFCIFPHFHSRTHFLYQMSNFINMK